MKKHKNYSKAKQLCFKPEINLCPHCNQPLKKSHIAWHKNIYRTKTNPTRNKLRLQMHKQKLQKHKRNLPLNRSRNAQHQILPIRHRCHNKNRPTILPKPPNYRPNQTNPNKPTSTLADKSFRNKSPNPSLPSTSQSRHKTKPPPTNQNPCKRRHKSRHNGV